MKNSILSLIALCMTVWLLPSCNNSNSEKNKPMETPMPDVPKKDTMKPEKMVMDNSIMQSMNMTMDKMTAMTMTGDFDLDFANMMIMHHQAAIDMSQAELAKGTDAEAKMMAQKIITAQTTEITQFQQIIANYKKPAAKMDHKEMHNELAESMHGMMDTMKSMTMTSSTDKNYVMMMIPHHEGAITMAEDELSHGKNLALKKMSQKIITDQKKEIADMQAWLTSHN